MFPIFQTAVLAGGLIVLVIPNYFSLNRYFRLEGNIL